MTGETKRHLATDGVSSDDGAAKAALWAQRDAEYEAALSDPDYLAEMNQIMAEFASADREAAAMLYERYGQYED